MIPNEEQWYKALGERHGEILQKKLSETTVAVCGLGGLGSAISVILARMGIGKLILTDFDKVDISNLHRQQYKASQIGMYKTEALKENLGEIAPYLKFQTYTEKMEDTNFKRILSDADIVCEAFDNAETKADLVNFVLASMPDKYVIASSGMAGLGSANEIHTRKISDRFYLCGDEKSDVSEGIGLIASRVMLCAAHQAHIVIEILANKIEKR